MKKIVVVLLALTMVTTFSACGVNEEKPVAATVETASAAAPTAAAAETKSVVTIKATDCYGDAGYLEFVAGAETSAEYTFTAENCETAQWSVYVFDEAFDDAFRYIGQSCEPALIGDGTLSVNAGQFLYIYCSANEFTDITAGENETLNITVK